MPKHLAASMCGRHNGNRVAICGAVCIDSAPSFLQVPESASGTLETNLFDESNSRKMPPERKRSPQAKDRGMAAA